LEEAHVSESVRYKDSAEILHMPRRYGEQDTSQLLLRRQAQIRLIRAGLACHLGAGFHREESG
jgi:hypothetical protein